MTLCPLCDRREPYRPQACGPCRGYHVDDLDELAELWPLVPAAAEPSLALSIWRGQRVSGSREQAAPIVLAAVDLALPPGGDVSDGYGDQIGAVPVAGLLDTWVREFVALRGAQGVRDTLPAPTVPALVGWLRPRVEWIFDTAPAFFDYAAEVRGCVAEVRFVLGISRRPTYYPTACPQCRRLGLYRRPGGRYVECGDCGCLLDDQGVTDLVETVEATMSEQ